MSNHVTKKQVISNILMLFAATSIGQVASGLSVLFTARPLGVDSFGQYSACFALTIMTSIFFTLGMDTWLLREGRRGNISLGKLAGSNLFIKALQASIWFIGLLVISRFLDLKTFPPHLLILCALATLLEATQQTVSYSFIVSLQKRPIAVLEISSSIGLLFSTLGLASIHVNDPMIYAGIRLIIAGLATLGGIFWLRKKSTLSLDFKVIKTTLQSILPFALSEAFLRIYTQADITIIAIILGKQAAGFYSPASNIIRAMFIIPLSVYLVMTPVISQLVAEGSPHLSVVIRQTYLSLSVIGGLLWLGTSLLGPGISNLVLGSKFSISGDLLVILSQILFLKSCSYASTAIIVATSGQGKRATVQALTAIFNILLNLFIIHTYGIKGVAWVYVISETVLLVGYMVIAENGRQKAIQSQRKNDLVIQENDNTLI